MRVVIKLKLCDVFSFSLLENTKTWGSQEFSFQIRKLAGAFNFNMKRITWACIILNRDLLGPRRYFSLDRHFHRGWVRLAYSHIYYFYILSSFEDLSSR